jgi:hypothetical protein
MFEYNGIHQDRTTLNARLLGDVIDLTPHGENAAHAMTFEVLSAPEGSTAQFDGPRLIPDAPGKYVLRMSAGLVRDTVRLFVFSPSASEALRKPAGVVQGSSIQERSDEQRRGILRSLARERPLSELEAINGGKWPANLHLAAHGG